MEHARFRSRRPHRLAGCRWPRLALASLAVPVLLAGLLSACNRGDAPPPAEDDGALKLEKSYTNQKLGPQGSAQYRFHARQRGAYLIVVYNNPSPLEITLRHPKNVCYLRGNGSCELVSGPDEAYNFAVNSTSGKDVQFSLLVTHSEGKGRYEGEVKQPLALDDGVEHDGSVGVNESSYYSFVADQAGPYTIALTGTQSDLLWRLFDAAEFDVILQECNLHSGAGDEVCQTYPLHPGQRYYVKVEEMSGVPGPFQLAVYAP